ncbi:aminotransferase class V-fold PLP-dependent enzyme [Agromyces mediolanus]|uniref:pyridoxal phosphate-dependent decarboxylase family protein n=1 Tax=Agromyces mediolanus TaxID=41986 RepID=UPI00203ACFFC|nr:pyridoxal-dependent decarboxylase [Agromyces mediolanus]MCM3656181.1 aminotransferase class V-fold PLP-dependent enzyme [Agromyces mediolanus]
MSFQQDPAEVLARLAALRAADAPTHGGRVLSYVYDSGRAELDELAAGAARLVQPVNGLDPTTFTSVAVMEGELVGFARAAFHGDEDVVGSATSGGTESCLLAVKTARDIWRAAGGEGRPRLVAPSTVHAAFHKAAELFDLALDLVPVSAYDGRPDPAAFGDRLGPDAALAVVSAPSYPFASLDPVAEIAALAEAAGVALHVDACIGGFALAFWPEPLPDWDFRVPGVTSLSADLHKYGYAPKGVSVLLTRGRDRQRPQYFATTGWPGYPVVNPTLAGSKPAGPLAAAWAITQSLGPDGMAELTAEAARATAAIIAAVQEIDGLRIVGDPVGPLLAVESDVDVAPESRVDPHRWGDAALAAGWQLQLQPGFAQPGGAALPRTTHLTVTPVTERVLPELLPALAEAADAVRGLPPIDGAEVLGELLAARPELAGSLLPSADGGAGADGAGRLELGSDQAAGLLGSLGLLGGEEPLATRLAPVLALVEVLPRPLTERLLVELIARAVEPPQPS